MTETATAIVIVGAGIAGVTLAQALRDQGHAGRLTLISDETAMPYDRPPLSKAVLIAGQAPQTLRDEGWFAGQGIDLLLGDGVVAIDARSVRLASGKSLAFDQLAIATGTRARQLKLAEKMGEMVHYLRTGVDAERLARALRPGARVAIIGGGVIGLEVAAAAGQRAALPVVIEAGDRLMARSLSPAGSLLVADHHRACGVDLRLGNAIAAIEAGTDGSALINLADGSEISADLIVVGIGAEPNVELAQTAGLVVEDGIVVDGDGRTSRHDIFAIGDVARFPSVFHGAAARVEQWQHAVDHAQEVAKAMLGGRGAYADLPWFWSDQGELSLQVVGRTTGDTDVERREGRGRVLFHFERGHLVGATSFNAPRLRRQLARLVGRKIDPAVLADNSVDLKSLCAG